MYACFPDISILLKYVVQGNLSALNKLIDIHASRLLSKSSFDTEDLPRAQIRFSVEYVELERRWRRFQQLTHLFEEHRYEVSKDICDNIELV